MNDILQHEKVNMLYHNVVSAVNPSFISEWECGWIEILLGEMWGWLLEVGWRLTSWSYRLCSDLILIRSAIYTCTLLTSSYSSPQIII